MVTAGKVMAMTFADLVASNAALSGEVRRSHEALKIAQLTIDKMKVELAYLRRMKYGRSSERLEHAQLELVGGQVASPMVELSADADPDDGLKSNVTSLDTERKKREPRTRPGLRELPAHLPRRTVVHTPQGACGCTACGAGLREIGQDVSEVLDYEPGTFHVVRHVRPKLACAGCRTITQALAPTRPMDRLHGRGGSAHAHRGEQVRRSRCATNTRTSVVGRRSWCFIEDEGGPLGVGLQEQAPNHLKLLR